MGLFDGFGLRKQRKIKDEKIAKAQQLMQAGDFEKAQDILFDIVDDLDDSDFEYREDELEQMCETCKASIKEQNEREKLIGKDSIIEQIKAALKAKDWRKAIQLLDIAEDNYDINYRSAEKEDLCIAAQEMCFDSDEVNDWSDAVYSKMYMRKKEDYIKLARELVGENNMYMAKNTLFLLNRKYNSAYMDDEVKALWEVVMEGKAENTTEKDEFYVVPRTDTKEEKQADSFEFEVPQREDALQDLQKQEALERLAVLVEDDKIDGKTYFRFSRNILCGSFVDDDGKGYIKEFDKNDDLYLLAKSFEEELGCMVYHVVDAGRTAYLLTVHKDSDRWAEERHDGDKIAALVYSLDEEDYCYDYVRIFNNNGTLGVDNPEDEYSENGEVEEEETEERTYILNVTEEEQHAEATARIRELAEKLGLTQTAVERWEKKSRFAYSDMEKGFVSVACTVRDIDERIKDFEEKKHAKVYHAIQNEEGAYLLYVGGDKYLWADEKLTRNDTSIYSDVTTAVGYNISAYFMDNCTEVYNAFAEVELFCKDGALSLKVIEKEKDPDIVSGVYSDAELNREIKKRLRTLSDRLGLDEMAYTYWCDGRICCSRTDEYGNVSIFPVEENSEYARIVQKLENSVNCMAYHIVDMGENLYLLNILFSSGLKYGRLRQDSDNISLLYCSRANLDDIDNIWYLDMDVKVTDGALVILEVDEGNFEENGEDFAEETEVTETLTKIEGDLTEKTEEEPVEDEDAESIRSYLEEEEYPDESYDDMASHKVVISESLKNQMRAEAKGRLNLFYSKKELTGIVLHYWDCDRVCCSLPAKEAGNIPPVDSNPVHLKALEYIEQKFECMVYHLVEEGDLIYALYVTPYKNCWPQERWQDGIMPVICCSAENPSDAHMATAAVTSIHMVLTCEKIIAAQLGETENEKASAAADEYDESIEAEKTLLMERLTKIAEASLLVAQKKYDEAMELLLYVKENYKLGRSQETFDYAYSLCQTGISNELVKADADTECKVKENETVKTVENTAEKAAKAETAEKTEQPAQEILPEIDGKDGAQWHIEAAEFYRSKQYTQALYCMENAAKLGVVDAMSDAAAMYRMGLGTQADAQKSVYWLQKAAEAGSCSSMYNLSHRYYKGDGVETDHKKAFYWAEKATEGDKPEYWFNLAHKYDNCKGVEENAEKYFYALEKAAQGGIKEAFFHCAKCYDSGYGVAEDKAKALYWYEKAAENGNTDAMLLCYRRYMDAVGIAADCDKATYWLAEACQNGNADALYELGLMYIDMSQDEEEIHNGYVLLEEAGERGHVDAMLRLADDYNKADEDSKVEANAEKAFYWYEKAAQAGSNRGMVFTFLGYYNGVGTEQNTEKAVEWLDASINAGEMDGAVYMCRNAYRAAEKGAPELYEDALYWAEIAANGGHEASIKELPTLYAHCIVYEARKEQPDPAKIVKHFEKFVATEAYKTLDQKAKADAYMSASAKILKIIEQYEHSEAAEYGETIIKYLNAAAEFGETLAMSILASIYIGGRFVDVDKELSFYWRKRAYDSGDTESAYALAIMYHDGFGCRQDYEKAFELFRFCAETGNIEAKERLLSMYAHGEGCERNAEKEFELSQELADAGSAYGQRVLGLAYTKGEGCQQDIDKAVEYFQKSAAQDDPVACYNLGVAYEYGYGCKIDFDKAFEMYNKAADVGFDEALEKVASFVRMKKIVDQEIEKGKEIALKYINSPDPEMRKLARELLDME